MATSSFKTALGGKLIRGRVDFSAEAGPALIDIKGFGGLSPDNYSIAGLPLGRQRDIVTIAGDAGGEDYSITIKGRTFTVTSGGTGVTAVRDALLALLTAPIQAELGIAAASSGGDAINLDSLVPGADPLNTAVTADTPANITLTFDALGPADSILAVSKQSAAFEVRATASITDSREFAIVG